MKVLKKSVMVILVAMLLFSMVSCGGSGGSSSGGSGGGGGGGGGGGTSAPAEKSYRDQVYDLIADTPIAFNGIGPKHYDSRANVQKGLPRDKKDPKDVTLGFSAGNMSSPYFITLIETTQQECEKLGFNVILQLNNNNQELTFQQLDSFIAQGVDAIIHHGDPTSSVPYYKRAAEAGIPVVCTSAQAMADDNPAITNILASAFIAGFYVGEYAAGYLIPDIFPIDHVFNWGAVSFGIATGDAQSRNAGAISGFLYKRAQLEGKPYPNKWAAIVDGYKLWRKWADEGKLDASADFRIDFRGYGVGDFPDIQGGQKGAADLFVAHPEIEILQIDTDTMFPGVEVVMKQYNLVPGKDTYIICGADGTAYGLEALKDDRIIAIANNSSSMNGLGMASCMKAIFVDGRDMNNIVANSYTPTIAITKKNADEFIPPGSGRDLALGIPWELTDIDDYNATIDENAEPFPDSK